MIESEFRDWMRGQLRSLDQRIKALAAEVKPAAKVKADRQIHGSIVSLGQKLVEQAKAGKVDAAGIVFVDDQGVVMTGWSADAGYFALAGAATFMGLQILEEFRQSEATNDADGALREAGDPALGEKAVGNAQAGNQGRV
jgi:hypothetical protein